MEKLTLSINGMGCGHCVATVRSTLERIKGVEVERVAVGSAALRYDAARSAPAAIVDAVSNAGYEAHIANGQY